MRLKDLLENSQPASRAPDLSQTATDDISYAIATLREIGAKAKTLSNAEELDKVIRRLLAAYRREDQARRAAPEPGK